MLKKKKFNNAHLQCRTLPCITHILVFCAPFLGKGDQQKVSFCVKHALGSEEKSPTEDHSSV